MKTVRWRTVFVVALCVVTASLLCAHPREAGAQSEPFVGEIMMVGFGFCPRGWAEADGQLLLISQNTALFSLYGDTYGGDGSTTFALPDLRGRVPVHTGTGPGLTPRVQGSEGGTEAETLSEAQMPSHNHLINAFSVEGDASAPTETIPAKSGSGDPDYSSSTANTTMAADTVSGTGGSQAHNNMPPYLTVRFCVALIGLYPSRN